jgi:hypothetical protein
MLAALKSFAHGHWPNLHGCFMPTSWGSVFRYSVFLMKGILFLIIGLVVGGVGGGLMMQSMPPEEGSAEEQVAQMEVDLKKANNRIAALEDEDPRRLRSRGSTFSDRARRLADDIRDGKAVSPDEVFRTMQPVMRDLSPLFDRMRERDSKRRIDSLTGEMARRYDLDEAAQAKLAEWFTKKEEEDAARYNALVNSDGTTLMEMMEASRDVRPDDGLDDLMPTLMSGEKLAEFQNERMAEKVERVQQEADMKLARLDALVGLDDAQRDQAFAVFAQGSRDFDPRMGFEGISDEAASGGNPPSVMDVLRPEQRQALETERTRRREEAEKDMAAIGLTLPADWDVFDDGF